MNKRIIGAATLVAALSLSTFAVGASAQGPADNADASATSKSATGVVSRVDDTYYLTPDEGDPIELRYGPSWFWGDASPLELLVTLGEPVTLVGQIRDRTPNDNASAVAHDQAADRMPVMHVRAIVGMELREKGRPLWAGGPKELLEVHPGFEGWSESQAEKAAERAAAKAARAEEKAAAKAARAEEKAAAKAARAEERSNRP